MIGKPVTVDTPVGAPILVAQAGHVVHVGDFISGDSDTSAYGRVVVDMRGMPAKFDRQGGYTWHVISQSTAAKLKAHLEIEMSHLQQARNFRVLVNQIAKVKP